MSNSNHSSHRKENITTVIAVLSLIAAVCSCVAAYLVLPQVQQLLAPTAPTSLPNPQKILDYEPSPTINTQQVEITEPPTKQSEPSQTIAPPLQSPTAALVPTNVASGTSKPLPTDTPEGAVNTVVDVKGSGMGKHDETETGVYIQAGDRITVSYVSGTWWIGKGTSCNGWGESQTPTDAGGYQGRDDDRVAAQIGCPNPDICRPIPSVPFGSLLGRISKNGGLFYIGDHAEIVAQESGILYLRMNYSNHNDVTGCPYGDGGQISVRINVIPQFSQ